MVFRKAEEKDIPDMMGIIKDAVEFMRISGVNQWQDGYPNEDSIRGDIAAGVSYVMDDGGKIAAMEALIFEDEPSYGEIEGKWLNDEPYAVIHRSAVSGDRRGQGIAKLMFSKSEELCRKMGIKNIRIDTHRDNKAMQALLRSCGFEACGTIVVTSSESDKLRTGYQKVL